MYNIEEFLSDSRHLEEFREAIRGTGNPANAEMPVAHRNGILLSAKIKLTPRCNLRCRMCGIWKYAPQNELPTERVLSLVREFKRLGTRKIHFSGGEPLTRPDLIQILELCARLKIRANITSNGTLINKERARSLIKSGVRGVSISLDGAKAREHDAIRGVGGSFKGAIKGIESLVSACSPNSRTRIRINTVIQRSNWRSLADITRLAGEIGASELRPMPVDSKGSASRLKKSELRDYNLFVAPEVLSVREKYRFSTDASYVYPFGRTKEDLKRSRDGNYALGYYEEHTCYAPWLHMFISWDGNAYPCCMMRGRIQSLGNVMRSSPDEVFSGPGYMKLREKFAESGKTGTLHLFPQCHRCDNFLSENKTIEDLRQRGTEKNDLNLRFE